MVVGGEVVVVGGELVGVVAVGPEGAPGSVEGEGDVVGGVVVEVLGVEVLGVETAGTALGEALAPGCSLATTTPMAMVAPVAAKAAERVNRLRRVAARRLASGVFGCGALLTGSRPRSCLVPAKRWGLPPAEALPVRTL